MVVTTPALGVVSLAFLATFRFEVLLQRLPHDLVAALLLELGALVLLPREVSEFILKLQVAGKTRRWHTPFVNGRLDGTLAARPDAGNR